MKIFGQWQRKKPFNIAAKRQVQFGDVAFSRTIRAVSAFPVNIPGFFSTWDEFSGNYDIVYHGGSDTLPASACIRPGSLKRLGELFAK